MRRSDDEVAALARQERIAFFAMLADGEHLLELRCRYSERDWRKRWAATPEQADEITHREALAGRDVYVGVAPRLDCVGEGQRRYAPTRAIYVDLDRERAVRALDLFEPSPTAVVLSGGADGSVGKRHAYWQLATPLQAEDVPRHVARLAHHLSADETVHDAARVLRVPGSRHHGTGRVARLADFTGEVHDLQELTGDLPDAPSYKPPGQPRPAKTTSELVALFADTRLGEKEGRHEAFRQVCGVLLRRCDALPPDVLLELACCWAERHLHPCRDRLELERQFDNLLDRERARRGLA
jgi:hypothetical protein